MPVRKVSVEPAVVDSYPLSSIQEGMLFHSLYAHRSGVDVEQMVCSLSEPIDGAAIERAWQAVSDRHPVLRTGFAWEGLSAPVQRVYARAVVPFESADWREFGEGDQLSRLESYLAADRRRGFDLSVAPLMRVALFRRGEAEYWLLWTFHHAVLDGRSFPTVLKEVFAFHEAFRSGRRLDLPPSRPYREYIEWLQGQDVSASKDFWLKTLSGFQSPTPLDLVGAANGNGDASGGYGEHELSLSRGLTTALRELSKNRGLTLNTLFQGVWALLLFRYSGVEDVVFGVTRAARPRSLPEVDSMVGAFINTLPLRVSVTPREQLIPWLQEVRASHRALRPYEHTPLVKIQEWSQVPRGTPLFRSLLVFETYRLNNLLRAQGTAWNRRSFRLLERTNYPLTVGGNDGPEMVLSVSYDRAAFPDDGIVRLVGHLRTLLEGMAECPDRTLSSLPMLTREERRATLFGWNETRQEFSRRSSIVEEIELHAMHRPDVVALEFGADRMSYRDLNIHANRLAHRLRRLGVGPEVVVGILLERSSEAVIAFLAVLKAGGAYLPCDPDSPPERLAFSLADAGVSVVVTQRKLNDRLPSSALVVSVEALSEEVEEESEENLAPNVCPDNLAYVLYTSGSGGAPKGVLISHKGLANHSAAIAERFSLSASDRVLQFAPLTFDVAAEELFPTLRSGGTVVFRPDPLPSLSGFTDFLREKSISVVNLPSSFWQEWASEVSKTSFPPTLRLVVAGSERVGCEALAAWRAALGDRVRWLNAYGLTETTITSTLYEPVGEDATERLPSVPIGRPIANTCAYVLDSNQEPVPVGVVGRLFVGGAGLSRGYLNHPARTAEAFLPDPFADEFGSRLFGTGDRAVFLPNGCLCLIGRVDDQVKIRGFRVELSEVESALASFPGVQEAVVVARLNDSAYPSLAGYVVLGPTFAEGQIELWPCMADYQVYDDLLYDAMTQDLIRNRGYRAAIRTAVKGKTVLEIGTGKDAILSRFCVEEGAERVYAIEVLDKSYRQACRKVKALGLEDRIILIHGNSSSIELPEKVDVSVSELIGTIGGSEGVAAVLNDARRFLKPEGTIIPLRCVTLFAAVSLPEELSQDPAFTPLSGRYAKQIWERVGFRFDFRVCIRNFPENRFVSDAGVFEDLNFSSYTDPHFSRRVCIPISREGKFDGFLLWLNLHTTQGEILDNRQQMMSWLPVYFPLFRPALDVRPGDRIEALCSGSLSDNGINPDYRVSGTLITAKGKRVDFAHESSHHSRVYKASGFYKALFSGNEIRVRSSRSSESPVRSLRAHVGKILPEYMVPSAITLLKALPRTATGKVDRTALSESDRSDFDREPSYVAPRELLERQLVQIWEGVFGIKRIGVTDRYFDLGGHSLMAVRLFSQIEKTTGRKLPLATIFQAPTIEKLAGILRQGGWSPDWSSLVAIQPAGWRPPFYCVHAVGGNVLTYMDLARHMGTEQPVYGLQAQGLDGKREPHRTIQEMAAHYVDEILKIQPQGPYYIGGSSAGGIVAFEMAQQLVRKGQEVGTLAMFDTWGPDYPRWMPGTSMLRRRLTSLFERVDLHLGNFLVAEGSKGKIDYLLTKSRRLKDRFAHSWRRRIKKLRDLPSGVANPLPRALRKVENMSLRATNAYVPQPYPGRVTLFRASKQPRGIYPDSELGWGRVALGGVDVYEVPGRHGAIVYEPRIRILAEQLRRCIWATQENASVRASSQGAVSNSDQPVPALLRDHVG